MRLLLADDERQRYSAWYKDSGPSFITSEEAESTTVSQHQPLTRSQQMLGMASSSGISNRDQQSNSLATVVDLQIALITSIPTVSKPMQVRLTRRGHCSDLRGHSSSLLSIPRSAPIPSYASPSASSSAHLSSINICHATGASYSSSLVFMIVSLLVSLFFVTIPSHRNIIANK